MVGETEIGARDEHATPIPHRRLHQRQRKTQDPQPVPDQRLPRTLRRPIHHHQDPDHPGETVHRAQDQNAGHDVVEREQPFPQAMIEHHQRILHAPVAGDIDRRLQRRRRPHRPPRRIHTDTIRPRHRRCRPEPGPPARRERGPARILQTRLPCHACQRKPVERRGGLRHRDRLRIAVQKSYRVRPPLGFLGPVDSVRTEIDPAGRARQIVFSGRRVDPGPGSAPERTRVDQRRGGPGRRRCSAGGCRFRSGGHAPSDRGAGRTVPGRADATYRIDVPGWSGLAGAEASDHGGSGWIRQVQRRCCVSTRGDEHRFPRWTPRRFGVCTQ